MMSQMSVTLGHAMSKTRKLGPIKKNKLVNILEIIFVANLNPMCSFKAFVIDFCPLSN